MKKTLTAAAVLAVISPVGSLALVSGAAAETSVSLGGYVRTGFIFESNDVGDDAAHFAYRGRLQLDAKNDAGVRGTLRLQGTSGGGGSGGTADANDLIDRALIQYNGVRFGYSDSFQTTFHGYGTFIERQDGLYGFDQAFMLDYSGTAGGFSYGVGIQDSSYDADNPGTDFDPYFGVGFSVAGASVKFSFLQDTAASESQYKVSADYSLGGTKLKVFFRDVSDANQYGTGSAYGVTAQFAIGDSMTLGVAYTDDDDDDADNGYASATLKYQIAEGLSLRPEINLYENDDVDFGFRLYRTF